MEVKSIMRNVSLYDIILNYLSYLKNLNIVKKTKTYLRYRSVYRNSTSILMNVYMNHFPIDAVLRNGEHIVLHNKMEVQAPCGHNILGGAHEGIEYDIKNDVVILSAIPFGLQGTITIYGGVTSGDIVGIYADKTYQGIPIRGKTIVDIGANIADSAIYFALSGAKKIVGIEPILKNYELAQKNIQLNKLQNSIDIKLAGCSNIKGEITMDPSYTEGANSTLKDFKTGSKIVLVTLKDILDEFLLPSDDQIILKMDCEGCEYKSILSAEIKTLKKFDHMMIEYHYGYKDLRQRLVESGFNVSITRPRLEYWQPTMSDKKYKLAIGHIIAKKN